jgi:predicted ATP-grasp superfamily ATP-dependent carboligase
MKRILITGAGGSAAYNFLDSLKQSNEEYYVVGCDMKPYHLELMPCNKKYLVPGVSDQGYVDAINNIIGKEDIEFVHPQPDVEVAFLSKHADKINAKVFLPPAEAVEACHDKMEFNKILTDKGVAVPKAYHINSQDDLKRALKELLKIQPKIWLRATRGAGSRASLPINSFYQGDAWVDYWRTFRGIDYGDFMASEFLPGHEFAWQSLWYEGELVTAQARERLEYIFGNLTPSGQTSSPSVAKTVNRDDINEAGQAAVRAISDKPHGVFCVDMKEGADGSPKVTEINPGRFFTTSNFFAHAGSNMPAMYIELGLSGQLKIKPK